MILHELFKVDLIKMLRLVKGLVSCFQGNGWYEVYYDNPPEGHYMAFWMKVSQSVCSYIYEYTQII